MQRSAIEPYTPQLHGDLLAYLSRRADDFEPAQFYGFHYFAQLGEMGVLIEDETQIELYTGTDERVVFFVTEERMLDEITTDEHSVAIAGNVADPRKTLAERVWSAAPLDLEPITWSGNRILS